jgi:hypothetical protein
MQTRIKKIASIAFNLVFFVAMWYVITLLAS